MLKGIILSLFLSLLWIAVQMAIFHIRRPRRMFLLMVSLFMVTVPLFPIVYLLTPPDLFFLPQDCSRASSWIGLGTGLFVHILFFFAYVEFFYYVERAVTLRMLAEIGKRGESSLKSIQEAYSVEMMVTDRLRTMKENRFVELKDGLWHLTPKGRFFARTFTFFRRILNLEAGQ